MTFNPNKLLVPVIAIVVGASGAWLARSTTSTGSVTIGPLTTQGVAISKRQRQRQSVSAKVTETEVIQGRVLETIAVPNYTYVRIELSKTISEKDNRDIWAAISKTEVVVGQMISIADAQRMDNFTSSTLGRTFEVIYFGVLSSKSTIQTTLPVGHRDIGVPPTTNGDAVQVGLVERAPGKLGHTVAELIRGRKGFAGQTVRLRGVVVKSTSGVLGRSFVHVRDGSGSSAAKDDDLLITINQEITVGSRLTFEGTVVTDKDFGSGYSYPILLENARTVDE